MRLMSSALLIACLSSIPAVSAERHQNDVSNLVAGGNINNGGVQNIASITQVGLLNFGILAQGQTASIAAPETGSYLNVQQALIALAPNSSAIIAILNTNTTINSSNTINGPVDISVYNSSP